MVQLTNRAWAKQRTLPRHVTSADLLREIGGDASPDILDVPDVRHIPEVALYAVDLRS